MDKTFIFEGIEVKTTGRFGRKAGDTDSKFLLCEITPISDEHGTWIKWVPAKDLFEVFGIPKERPQ
jgi:hypothetical protein